ncbi:MAG: hypothetical protein JO336_03495 [Acidobacteriia bacterium]|nr:hypothetical protein [Terriglobia bacterium]
MNFFPNARSGRAALPAFAAFCSLIGTAYGVDPDRAMSQYVHDRWGVEQGFPRGAVYAITQSADGYLWIGTEAGLVRFDGWNFRLIKDDSGVFTMASVLGLVADRDGSLWVRLQDFSVLRYRNGVFDRPSPDAQSYTKIDAMSRTNRGEPLLSKMQTGAFAFRPGGFQLMASADELPRSPVTTLGQTPQGDVWLGTRDAGLFRFAGGRVTNLRSGLPDLKIDSLLPGEGGDLWVGTDSGIVRWNGHELTAAGVPAAMKRVQALAMVRDRDRNIWVGTDSQGLWRINSHGAARGANNQSAAQLNPGTRIPQAITTLFEDREGDLWIGHADGIERVRDSAFVTYSTEEGLPAEGGSPVFVDSQSRVWFAPRTGGLWWVKDEQRGRVGNAGLNQDVVYSLAGAGSELWVGRQRGGLTRLRLEQGLVTANTYTQADGLAQDSVYSVYLSPDGTVWAGTLSGGVSMLRDGRFTNFTIANGLASNTVVSISETSDGAIWFATPTGLSSLSKGEWQTYTAANGLPSENVDCLLEDSTGVLWVGTASGIAYRARRGFQVPAAVPALLREQIFGLAEDKYGWLWMVTSSHVLRVNRSKLLKGTLGESDIRSYGIADGLRGLEGVKRHRSVIEDSRGRVWFSLNRGISVVNPDRLTRDAAPAIAHVQALRADGESVPVGSDTHVAPGRRRITLGYSGLSLSIPERVRYRFWLEGFDRGWGEPTAAREAVYTNLPPSTYRFRLMATNTEGVWSKDEAAVAFTVDPLFWQTWWFRVSVIFVCLAAIWALYRFRLKQATSRMSLRFEERLAERTRIAQELHDTLLQGFLSASMQVHVAADSLPDDSRAKPTLNRALELMSQVIDEARSAVRGLRSSHTVSLDLELAFSRIQEEFVPGENASEHVDFRVIVDGEQRALHPILRDEVYRIGREALLNAFRHARAKKIEMELKYSPNRLCVLVRDDGCGIDPNVLRTGRDGHWGLSGMRERAERIGARLQVMSSAFSGTEIELSVPANVAFDRGPDRKLRWFSRDKGHDMGVPQAPFQNGKGR